MEVVIRHGVPTRAISYTTEDLLQSSFLTIGQAFNAVANHYDKTPGDYKAWPYFATQRGAFDAFKDILEECANDLERLHCVCEWLDEEPI